MFIITYWPGLKGLTASCLRGNVPANTDVCTIHQERASETRHKRVNIGEPVGLLAEGSGAS